MRVFLYEYVTGGGWWGEDAHAPAGSLLAEGSAMVRALAADFQAIPEVSVVALADSRLSKHILPDCELQIVSSTEEEQAALRAIAAEADRTLLIAPEWNGELARRSRFVLAAGGKLLSPGPEFIELAADKHATAEHLRSQGVPAPLGILIEPRRALPRDFPFPAVLKPRDGAGSQGLRLFATAKDFVAKQSSFRLEQYHPGTAASVAVLSGPAGHIILPACSQRQSQDGIFTYLGGETPLSSDLNAQARRLAEACLAALPPATGYVGFDLVLGKDTTGENDVVIEVNPRMTTSYVGLRALAKTNLAAAMLAVAEGRPVELSFSARPIEFRATGEVAR
jgi:predicted ATP-grasp superfamily ATP-dependent carboligase